MKKFTLLFAVASLCAVSFGGSLKSEVMAWHKKVLVCMKKMDIEGFKKITSSAVTKDFKYVENGKTMNYDEMVAMMKEGMTMTKKITKADLKLMNVKENGNTGSASSRHTMTGITVGPDKKNHTMTFDGTSNETYRKEGGKWKLVSMTWVKQTMTMDGKPFDPTKMGG